MGSLQMVARLFVVLTLLNSAGAQILCGGSSIDIQARQVILNLHNKLRTLVAVGAARPAPSGGNIYALTYNCSLEQSAQRVADTCSTSGSAPSARLNIGENTFMHNGAANKVVAFVRAYTKWQSANGWTTGQTVFTPTLNAIGLRNFAQMAWGSTTVMGCGYKVCNGFQSVVCHYMTEGAIVNQTAYQLGQGCRSSQECTTFTLSTCAGRLCRAPPGAILPPQSTSTTPAELTCEDVPSILNHAHRMFVLGKHNRIRSDLVNGRKINQMTRRGCYKMFAMKYDCALEKAARVVADGTMCAENAVAPSPPTRGQNVHILAEAFISPTDVLTKAIAAWTAQIQHFDDKSDMGTGSNVLEQMGHFAQMAFWKTTAVGCSIGKCGDARTAVVCRYRVARAAFGKVYPPVTFKGCLENKCKEGYNNATCNATSGLCQLP